MGLSAVEARGAGRAGAAGAGRGGGGPVAAEDGAVPAPVPGGGAGARGGAGGPGRGDRSDRDRAAAGVVGHRPGGGAAGAGPGRGAGGGLLRGPRGPAGGGAAAASRTRCSLTAPWSPGPPTRTTPSLMCRSTRAGHRARPGSATSARSGAATTTPRPTVGSPATNRCPGCSCGAPRPATGTRSTTRAPTPSAGRHRRSCDNGRIHRRRAGWVATRTAPRRLTGARRRTSRHHGAMTFTIFTCAERPDLWERGWTQRGVAGVQPPRRCGEPVVGMPRRGAGRPPGSCSTTRPTRWSRRATPAAFGGTARTRRCPNAFDA